MPQPACLYIAVTNHGYGHATRLASVLSLVQASRPDIRLIFATRAPRWLITSYLPGEFELRPVALDVGLVQPDSLRIDEDATLLALEEWRRGLPALVAAESEFVRKTGAKLILGDIPPAAPLIARAAGRPCWMLGNFDWAGIYRGLGGAFDAHAHFVADCHAGVDRLYRPPLHMPMESFPHILDIGLTGGSPGFSAEEARIRWGLRAPRERTVLITFGGMGVEALPYARLADFPDWSFITWDRSAPDLPNLVRIDAPGWRPVDLMPAASRLIGKPGYSTYAEALRQGLVIHGLPRPGFIEAGVLLDGVRDHALHEILTRDEFFGGDWSFLRRAPHPPRLGPLPPEDGCVQLAEDVLSFLAEEAR